MMGFRHRQSGERRDHRARARSGVLDTEIAAACSEELAVIVEQRSIEYAERTAG
jgi:hypothetical protein